MELTLGDIFSMCSPSHGQSLVKLSNLPLPIKVAYKISRLFRIVWPEYEAIEVQRAKLVQKYASENEGTTVGEENRAAFVEEFTSLLNETVNVAIEPLNIEELGGNSLSAQELLALEKIIVSGAIE